MENIPDNNKARKMEAEDALGTLEAVLFGIERSDGVIDLNRTYSNSPEVQQVDLLRKTLMNLKANLEYLDPRMRIYADDYILRAEIYLAGHIPDQKSIKKSIDIDPFIS